MYVLLISCPDSPRIISKVSDFIAEFGGNITEAHHFLEKEDRHFFMRNEIEGSSLKVSIDEFREKFVVLAKKYNMKWRLSDSKINKKMLILGSNSSHCVADLLHRHYKGERGATIVGLLSNHNKLKDLANKYEIPFKFIDVVKDKLLINKAIDSFNPDLIVLARYMQIIPNSVCAKYENRIINIHHSFLPSFKGANPYRQAKVNGVKIIGSTCHFVNENLDEGAIIEQGVERINHHHSEEDMRQIGQDIEKITLARGVKLYLESRIIAYKNRTIIFE